MSHSALGIVLVVLTVTALAAAAYLGFEIGHERRTRPRLVARGEEEG